MEDKLRDAIAEKEKKTGKKMGPVERRIFKETNKRKFRKEVEGEQKFEEQLKQKYGARFENPWMTTLMICL